MTDDRVPLKNPLLAAVLAYLLPGLGHVYQGRLLKAGIYSVCILGTFLGGMTLGDWQPVYYRMDSEHSRFSYFSQAMVGLPALPALVQKARYERSTRAGVVPEIDGPLVASFQGAAVYHSGDSQAVHGRVTLTPGADDIAGAFEGQDRDGQPVSLRLSSPLTLQQRVYPSRDRTFVCAIVDSDGSFVGELRGYIPRSVLDWFEVPLGHPGHNEPLAAAHGRLGKMFDLASVFTWVAGLLNVLAMWDAYEGPAYGYGDESEDGSSGNGNGGDDA